MENSGQPMNVSDPELRQRIKAEYAAMMADQVEVRVQPLLSELWRRGFTVTAYTGMPSLTLIAPKWLISELAQRADVSTIYLIESKEQPALNSATPTDRAPIVWERGFDGMGKLIAILEHGNVAKQQLPAPLAEQARC